MQNIGRYEIIRELGRGGMATVYLARDPAFERQVAVKVLPLQLMHEGQFLVRFRREAKMIAALEHPYIVPVYDYGEENEQPYIVMRYMSGGTLGDRLSGQPMPLPEAIAILHRLAEALDEAHHQNIVHRDLKPVNVMFDARGHAFLSDFGIAKMMQASVALTGSLVVGTPAYMSPEQAVGDKDIDSRSDIYSLGVILYEMLTGRHPYEADTPVRMLLKHVTEPVPQLSEEIVARLGLPEDSNPVLAQAMAKKPEERYATAGEFVQALSALATGLPAITPAPLTLPALPTELQQAIDSPLIEARMTANAERADTLPTTTPTSALPQEQLRPLPKLPVWGWMVGGVMVLALFMGGYMLIKLPSQPTATSGPPSATSQPTPTNVSPTLTSQPTATNIPPTPTPQPTATVVPPTLTTEPTATRLLPTPTQARNLITSHIRDKDSMVEVYVPTGQFLMGSADNDSAANVEEKPQHTVYLDAYWIDQTEVTNIQFNLFVQATVYQTEAEKDGSGYVLDLTAASSVNDN